MKRKNYRRITKNYALKRAIEKFDEVYQEPTKPEPVFWAGSDKPETAKFVAFNDDSFKYAPVKIKIPELELRENFTYNRKNKTLLHPLEQAYYQDTMNEMKDFIKTIAHDPYPDTVIYNDKYGRRLSVKLSSKITVGKDGNKYREAVSFTKAS